MTNGKTVDIMRIKDMIPHRYPFLLIDRVEEIIPGESAIGIKNVTVNEPFFQGHFPCKPVMPGVLIIEAMAQTSGILVIDTLGSESEGRLVYFMSIDGARFRHPVGPGDVLRIHTKKEHARRNVWRFRCEAKVNDIVVAEATITAMIADE